jgi:phosphoribosylanthranilate isomerase
MMARTRLKVCCIASAAEAACAVRHGADAVGLVSAMPSGPGPIDDHLIARIARTVPPPIASFLLTCQTTAGAIIQQARAAGCNTLQLVDHVPPDQWPALREALPQVRLVQVIHVTGEDAIPQAIDAASRADAILLDSGNPSLVVKELGGTGRPHDWSVSRRIVEEVQQRRGIPVFLAGGLNAGNVAQAVGAVHPFGVDLCSGVRTGGRLDEAKLIAFTDALWAAAG